MWFLFHSIGSLAKDFEAERVQIVTVRNTTFTNTQNGLGIKSWARPSKGFVEGVQSLDAIIVCRMFKILVINQNYCPQNIDYSVR